MASEVYGPLVSIIVPMYNVGTFAPPCVSSLLDQTYSNIEILIAVKVVLPAGLLDDLAA